MDRKDEIQNHLNSLRDQIDAKRDSISNIMANITALKQQVADCNASLQLQDSRTAYAISLYSKISHITWNYKGASGRLCGRKLNFEFS
jgi:archaellum component FlaC